MTTYTLAGITFAAQPTLQVQQERPAQLVGTLSGGHIRWSGNLRESLHLEGSGLSAAERATLNTALAEGLPVAFDDGVTPRTVLLAGFRTRPLIGTTLLGFQLDLVVLPPA